MPELLLATKHHCPAPAPDLMLRPQVTGLLDAGLRGRLTLISAPAGFGKTTLVAQWLASRMKDEDGRMKASFACQSPEHGANLRVLCISSSLSERT